MEAKVEPIGFAETLPHRRDAEREQVSFANPPGAEWYGIRDGGRLISFFCLVAGRGGRSARFKSSYTVPDMRRRGCLGASIRFTLKKCARRGIPALTAFCTASSLRSHVAHGVRAGTTAVNGVTFVRYAVLKRRTA